MLNPSCPAWRNVDEAKEKISEGSWYIPTASANAVNRHVAHAHRHDTQRSVLTLLCRHDNCQCFSRSYEAELLHSRNIY